MEPLAPTTFCQHLTANPAAWLFWANVAVWLGLCAYLAFLGRTQAAIRRRIRRLESDSTEKHPCLE